MKAIFYILFVGLLAWFFGGLMFAGYVNVINPDEPFRKTDAIIILTGDNNRIKVGLDLLSEGKTEYVFISGVNELISQDQILAQNGFMPDDVSVACCVSLGYAANNTQGNALETSLWLNAHKDVDSIRLITSDYHILRSLLEFSILPSSVEIIPHVIKTDMMLQKNKYAYLRQLFYEYNKLLVTWIKMQLTPQPFRFVTRDN